MPQLLKIHPSQKQHILYYVLSPFIIIILLIIPFIFWDMKNWLLPFSYLSALFLFLRLLYTYAYVQKYQIIMRETGIEFSHGVFSRKTESVEMHRIIDFTQNRNLFEMIFNLATISINSTDATTPVIKFVGLEYEDSTRILRYLQQNASDSLVKLMNKAEDDSSIETSILKASQQRSTKRKEP